MIAPLTWGGLHDTPSPSTKDNEDAEPTIVRAYPFLCRAHPFSSLRSLQILTLYKPPLVRKLRRQFRLFEEIHIIYYKLNTNKKGETTMSINSNHQLHPEMNGGSYAKASIPAWAMQHANNIHYPIVENLENAGNTRFDLRDIMVGYIRGRGRGRRATIEIGYGDQLFNATTSVKIRLRNAGPHKMRELHELMKAENAYHTVDMHAPRVPLFYTFERLLQLFFPDYVAIPIPHHIRNWVPEEGSFWAHWWKARQ